MSLKDFSANNAGNTFRDEDITVILKKDKNNVSELADSLVAEAKDKGGRILFDTGGDINGNI